MALSFVASWTFRPLFHGAYPTFPAVAQAAVSVDNVTGAIVDASPGSATPGGPSPSDPATVGVASSYAMVTPTGAADPADPQVTPSGDAVHANTTLADETRSSATQPAPAPPQVAPPSLDGPPGRGVGPRGNWRRGVGGYGMGQPLIGPEQRELAMAWLAQHAPNQTKTIKALPPDRQVRWENAIAQAYANYQRVRDDDADLYRVIVARVEVEDRVYGLGADYRKATDESARTSLRAQLVKAVNAQVDVNLHERQLRLERLKRTVSQAEEKLAKDTANRQQMVDERLRRISHGEGNNWPAPTTTDAGR